MMAEAVGVLSVAVGSVVDISGVIIVLMGKVCGECASDWTAALAVVLNAIEGWWSWAVVSPEPVKVERVDVAVAVGVVLHNPHLFKLVKNRTGEVGDSWGEGAKAAPESDRKEARSSKKDRWHLVSSSS